MTYVIVYVEHGDFVAEFASHEEARVALVRLVGQHPEIRSRVGILPFGDDGLPAGDFEPAASLLEPSPAA